MRKKHVLALILTLLIVFSSTPNVNAESSQIMSSAAFGVKLANYTYPVQINKGTTFQMKGTITSVNKEKITKVCLLIDGKVIQQVSNDSDTFDLKKISQSVFSVLKEGTYKLEIAVYNGSSKCITGTVQFKILPAFSAVISGYTPPSEILIGNGYSLKGKITSASDISRVTVVIDGVIKGEVSCNTKSFSMSSIDAKVKFGTLEAGQHTIKIVAYGKYGGSKTVAEHKFKVTNIIFGSDAKKSAVSEKSLEIISQILKNASVKSCKITSTVRTAYEQAEAMYDNCRSSGVQSQYDIYGSNGSKVIKVYEDEMKKSGGLRGTALIKEMEKKIIQIGIDKFNHCGDHTKLNVIDIGYGSISNKTAFRKALNDYMKKNSKTFYFIDEPKNSCFHLEIKQ